MIGAILGDMIGAPYEFDRGRKSKVFPLFSQGSGFTDDSVMTIAVAEALLKNSDGREDQVKNALVQSMQKWGRQYPNAGYGARFIGWIWENSPKPYGSYGNGSAMRVAAAGWMYNTLERTREVACWTAEVTHNHPEGIKGALFSWLARATVKKISRHIFSGSSATTSPEPVTKSAPDTTMWRFARKPSPKRLPPSWRDRISRT